MNRTTLSLLVLLLVAIGASAAYYLIHTGREARTPQQVGNTPTTTPDLTGQAIFTDGEYGFYIRYPEAYATAETFASYYHLPAAWRSNAAPDGTGTPIVAIVGYRTQSDHSYPRYFDAEIRIGASSDPKEVARCETAATDQAEQPLPDMNLGGTAFKAFSFQSAGMMQYLKGVSYRTLHNGTCFAIEQLETGSSYHDDPASPDDVPQATLDQKYQDLDAVLKTFAFVAQ